MKNIRERKLIKFIRKKFSEKFPIIFSKRKKMEFFAFVIYSQNSKDAWTTSPSRERERGDDDNERVRENKGKKSVNREESESAPESSLYMAIIDHQHGIRLVTCHCSIRTHRWSFFGNWCILEEGKNIFNIIIG